MTLLRLFIYDARFMQCIVNFKTKILIEFEMKHIQSFTGWCGENSDAGPTRIQPEETSAVC